MTRSGVALLGLTLLVSVVLWLWTQLAAHVDVHVMPAGRVQGGPLGWLKAWAGIRAGRAMARALYAKLGPKAVIGFGGYPALPALLAALDRKSATAVHEQNAVLGRVNRLLARRVDLIAR